MSQPLYSIVDSILAIMDAVDDTGEMIAGAESLLDTLDLNLAEKADNVARFIRLREAEAAGYKAEADRLASLARSAHNAADRGRAYLKFNLERAGMVKLDTPLFKLAIQRNSAPSVTVAAGLSLDLLPAAFIRTTITRDLDRIRVLETVKAGGELPAGIKVENGSHLRIR